MLRKNDYVSTRWKIRGGVKLLQWTVFEIELLLFIHIQLVFQALAIRLVFDRNEHSVIFFRDET